MISMVLYESSIEILLQYKNKRLNSVKSITFLFLYTFLNVSSELVGRITH